MELFNVPEIICPTTTTRPLLSFVLTLHESLEDLWELLTGDCFLFKLPVSPGKNLNLKKKATIDCRPEMGHLFTIRVHLNYSVFFYFPIHLSYRGLNSVIERLNVRKQNYINWQQLYGSKGKMLGLVGMRPGSFSCQIRPQQVILAVTASKKIHFPVRTLDAAPGKHSEVEAVLVEELLHPFPLKLLDPFFFPSLLLAQGGRVYARHVGIGIVGLGLGRRSRRSVDPAVAMSRILVLIFVKVVRVCDSLRLEEKLHQPEAALGTGHAVYKIILVRSKFSKLLYYELQHSAARKRRIEINVEVGSRYSSLFFLR